MKQYTKNIQNKEKDSRMNNLKIKSKLHINFKDKSNAEIINVAWPILAELLLSSLFGMMDMMMLGRMRDTAMAAASVAAVGMTNQPLFIGLSLVQALNVGGTAMISRYYGANQNERIETTMKHVLLLCMLVLAIPLSVLGLIFTDSIMNLMGAQADTLAVGRGYFKIIMIGFIFQSFNMAISAALRGVGETKVPMTINLRCNFLNVFGNAVLIYGLIGFPRLGITGAGISTALSNMVASIIIFRYVFKGNSIVKFDIKKPFKIDERIVSNIFKIGIPASLEQIVMRAGVLLFARIVAGLGTIIYAAHQVALSILSLSFQPGQAFGIAASSLVGIKLGAGEYDGAEEYAGKTRRIGSIISTLMAVILFFFGPWIVRLYSGDPVIIKNASNALKIIALVQPFQSSQLILAGALRGAGDTFWPLVATFFSVILVRVVLTYLFVSILGYGLLGAWTAVLVDQLVRWGFVYARFKTGKWKYIRIR